MKDNRLFAMTDHLCRFCGSGRILKWTNHGPTGGGNPIHVCSQCNKTQCEMGTSGLCWCHSVSDRGGLPFENICVATTDDRMLKAIREAGWRLRFLNHGMQVWWHYVPEVMDSRVDLEAAEREMRKAEANPRSAASRFPVETGSVRA